MPDAARLYVVALRGDEYVELVGGGHVGLVASVVERVLRHGRLQERGLRDVVDHEVPRCFAIVRQRHQCVAPFLGTGRGCAVGLACCRHGRQLHQEAVPRLVLVRLQGFETENVALRQLMQNLGQCPPADGIVGPARPEERVVEKRMRHGRWGEGRKGEGREDRVLGSISNRFCEVDVSCPEWAVTQTPMTEIVMLEFFDPAHQTSLLP
jgi:hypothetical protein